MQPKGTCYSSIQNIIQEYILIESKNAFIITDFDQCTNIALKYPATNFLLWKDELTDLSESTFIMNQAQKNARNVSFYETQNHETIERKNDFFDWVYDAYILNKCFFENKKKDFYNLLFELHRVVKPYGII
jgi:hypothetical protein